MMKIKYRKLHRSRNVSQRYRQDYYPDVHFISCFKHWSAERYALEFNHLSCHLHNCKGKRHRYNRSPSHLRNANKIGVDSEDPKVIKLGIYLPNTCIFSAGEVFALFFHFFGL